MIATGDTMPDNLIGLEFVAEETYDISVGRLMWLPFKHNRLALIGSVLLIVIYLATLFAGFLDEEGNFGLRPFVYAMESKVDAICSQEEPPLQEI